MSCVHESLHALIGERVQAIVIFIGSIVMSLWET